MKRKERHKIKTSEIAPYVTKALELLKEYQKEIIAAAIIVVLILTAGATYNYYRNRKIEQANIILYRAMKEQKVETIKELKDYPSPFPQIASMMLAAHQLEKGKLEEALKELEKAENRGNLSNYVLFMEAKLLCIQGKIKEALDKFNKIKVDRDFPEDALLYEKALCLERAGKLAEALSSYRLIVEGFSNSPYYAYALSRIQALRKR